MTPINILFWRGRKKVAVVQQQKAWSTNNSMLKLNPSGQNLPLGSLNTGFRLQQFVLLLLEWSLSTICLFQLIMPALASHKVINPNHSVHFHTCQTIIQHLAYLFYPSGTCSHTNTFTPRNTQASIFSLHLVILNVTHCPWLHNGK